MKKLNSLVSRLNSFGKTKNLLLHRQEEVQNNLENCLQKKVENIPLTTLRRKQTPTIERLKREEKQDQ